MVICMKMGGENKSRRSSNSNWKVLVRKKTDIENFSGRFKDIVLKLPGLLTSMKSKRSYDSNWNNNSPKEDRILFTETIHF